MARKMTKRMMFYKLLDAFVTLEKDYVTLPTSTEAEARIEYMYDRMIDQLLNDIKVLEWHCRDDLMGHPKPVGKIPSYRQAIALIRLLVENVDPKNSMSDLTLKKGRR